MQKVYTSLLLTLLMVQSVFAVDVTVTMNTTSKTMALVNKATDAAVEVGTPTSNKYSFAADAGTYVLTAYGSDATTVNGTIELNITEADKDFTVLTCTAYATNTGWTEGTDYTFAVDVNTREGVEQVITVGNSTTAGRKTFLALGGNSYNASFIPNAAHQAEGYMTLYKGGTLTSGTNISGAIPTGSDYTVTLPADAELYLGVKFAHFLKFQEIEPTKTEINGSNKEVTYRLANAQAYNYRTWREGGLTQAGYFTMNTDATKCPVLAFTAADYEAFGQKTIKHDVQWNGGYETGDIFVNINERGHLKMNVGDKYDAHAMRTWELTDNSTNNYFIEPDFHYTVINPDGTPSTGVIEIENPNTTTDPWSTVKAVGKGTAIVLVTYDAIGLNYYSSGKTDKTAYQGGEYWSAIWPENTAAYVVTVGDAANSIVPNMLINETYNEDTKKNAGKYVDAEHDVFYYLDTEEGYTYTFTPTGVADVKIAYPAIGAQSATYSGFASTGVTKNADGSYSVLLKEGRQIVELTDASGNAVYQVLTAKSCHREITNASRPGSEIFQPGDKVKIQYSGLRHPSNKLAGIYNMSGYVTYNGIPNGSSLINGSGQYTFGSAASAQAVSIEIPADYDVATAPNIVLNNGVIQVNGFGDPIGNHRLISRVAGRSANFTAISHKTYFGAIPDVSIPVTATRELVAVLDGAPADASIVVTDPSGKVVEKQADGKYHVTYGTYKVEGQCDGYRALHSSFTLGDDAQDETTFTIALVAAAEGTWNGTTTTEPAQVDDVYQISNAAELAWVASTVNAGTNISLKAELTADIDLGDYAWTPVGSNTTTKQFKGQLNGNNHTVSGLYINSTATYQGLFGYTNGATLKDFTVEGSVTSTANYAAGAVGYAAASTLSGITNKADVSGKQYVGGITSYANGATTIDCCVNNGNITGTSTYVAGITPYMQAATTVVTNCLNTGDIDGTGYVASVVANVANAGGTVQKCVNIGRVLSEASTTGNVYAGTAAASTRTNVKDNYVLRNYAVGSDFETVVSAKEVASGKLAYTLGEPWGQEVATQKYPVPNGKKVYLMGSQYVNTSDDLKNYDVRTLTFEDADSKGQVNTNTGASTWSSLIDDVQYGGSNLYDDENGCAWWYDENNTELLGGGNNYYMPYYSGGWAISNYYKPSFKGTGYTEQLAIAQAKSYNQFAVVYSYRSGSSYDMAFPTPLEFADDEAHVVESADVALTSYTLNSLVYGDSFNHAAGNDSWLAVNFEGTHADGTTATVTVKLFESHQYTTDWQNVDLTSMGAVTNFTVYVTGSADLCGDYGLNAPGYVAVDNIAVRFDKVEAVDVEIELADKTEYTRTSDVTVKKLTYTRGFDATSWEPLFVPFASSREAWGDDVEITQISGKTDSSLKLSELASDATVEANTPYFIRAKETCDIAVVVENATLVAVPSSMTSTVEGVEITGAYSSVVLQPGNYVLQNGGIDANSDECTVPSMSWYVSGGLSSGVTLDMSEVVTSVEKATSEVDNDGVTYNLLGQRVSENARGIVIRNGKKYINKK